MDNCEKQKMFHRLHRLRGLSVRTTQYSHREVMAQLCQSGMMKEANHHSLIRL